MVFQARQSTGQRGTARDAYRCRGSALSPPADLEGAMEWEVIIAAVLYLAFVALIIWWFWHRMR
jgi:cyanate permease